METSKGSDQQPIDSKKNGQDCENPLLANEWPHIRVNVPHARNKRIPLQNSMLGCFGDHENTWFGNVYRRISSDWDEPPVRAAIGLVLAVIIIAICAFLAPVALFKAILVAVAGLAGISKIVVNIASND